MVTEHKRMRQLYATENEWVQLNPLLLEGEFALSVDVKQHKVGDGATLWVDLDYWSPPEADTGTQIFRTTADAGDGTIWGDTNATDFTGQPDTTGAFAEVRTNTVCYFIHDSAVDDEDVVYFFANRRPLTLGVGAPDTALESDFIAFGGLVSWDEIIDKPSTFPPDPHNHDGYHVKVAGDTMTGDLTLPRKPIDDLHAATKNYVGVSQHDDTATYLFDDLVSYGGSVYHCILAHTAEPFSLTNFSPIADASGTAIQFNYEWTTTESGQVPSGQYGTNATDPLNATVVRVSSLTATGNNITAFWQSVNVGDYTGFIEGTGGAEHAYFLINGAAVEITATPNYFEIPVTPIPDAIDGVPENNRDGIVSLLGNPKSRVPVDGDADDRLMKIDGTPYAMEWRKSDRTKWRSEWVNVQYHQHDFAKQGDWAGVALVDTIDPLEPQPQGDARHLLPDAPTWSILTTPNANLTGFRIKVSPGSLFAITGFRVWVPDDSPNYKYEVWTVDERDPTNLIYKKHFEGTGDTLGMGWSETGSDLLYVYAGLDFSVILRTTNSAGSTIITGGWRYDGTDNNSGPDANGWNRNTQSNTVRIDKTDLDSTDRTSELLGIINGSSIKFVTTAEAQRNVEYAVVADPVDQGSYVEYQVTQTALGPIGPPSEDDVTTMTADTPTPAVTKYSELVDGSLASDDLVGIIATDGLYANVVETDDAYGLDLLVQEYTVSEDWDLLPNSGGGGGSGGSGGDGISDAPSNGVKYVRKNAIWVDGNATEGDSWPANPTVGDQHLHTADPVGSFQWFDDGDSLQWVQMNGGSDGADGADGVVNATISSSPPSGGEDGDIWYQVDA